MKSLALLASMALIASSLLAQLTAAEPAAADRPSAREAIAAMDQQFEKAFATGDAATIADQYTKDAQSFMMYMKPVSGRTAIKAEWKRELSAMRGAKIGIQTLEVQEAGDWAYETERAVQTFPDGRVVESKWLLIWKFEDGKWRVHRESGSDNAPSEPSTQNTEATLNNTGYRLLRALKTAEAIEVFELNVKLFPNSANVYDSLGEAYAAAGDKPRAIQNYEKSLELNPKSESGKAALAKLKQ